MAYIPLSGQKPRSGYVPLREQSPEFQQQLLGKVFREEKQRVFKEEAEGLQKEAKKKSSWFDIAKETVFGIPKTAVAMLGGRTEDIEWFFTGKETPWYKKLQYFGQEIPGAIKETGKEFAKAPFRVAATIVDPWVRFAYGEEDLVGKEPLELAKLPSWIPVLPKLGKVPPMFQNYRQAREAGLAPLEAGIVSGSGTALDLAISAGFAQFFISKVPVKIGSVEMVSTAGKTSKVSIGQPLKNTQPNMSQAQYRVQGNVLWERIPTKQNTVKLNAYNVSKTGFQNTISKIGNAFKKIGITYTEKPPEVRSLMIPESARALVAAKTAPSTGVMPPVVPPSPKVPPVTPVTPSPPTPIAPPVTAVSPAEAPIASSPYTPLTEQAKGFSDRFQELTPTKKAIYKNKLAKLRKEGMSYDEARYTALIRAEKYVAPVKAEAPPATPSEGVITLPPAEEKVRPAVGPPIELRGLPPKEEVLMNIEVAEKELQKTYGGQTEKVNEELGKIWSEMEMSEKGERFMVRKETGEYEFIGKDSSFPDWIPEGLRNKELFDAVIKRISDIKNLKYPEGNRPAQRELYNLILDELDSRLKIDTTEIRDRLMENYEALPKEEVPKITREVVERRAKPSEEEIKPEELFLKEIKEIKKLPHQISRIEAVKIVRKYFDPSEVGIEFVDGIRTKTGKQLYALGKYQDAMISFLKNPRAGVPEHEAVHAYIDLFTSEARKMEVLKEVLARDKDITTLREAEERLADDFVAYARHEKTFYGKILRFLSDLLAKIKRFFNRVPRDKTRKLYDDIIARKREADIEIKRKLATEPKPKEIPLTTAELEAYNYIEKGMPMPEELKPAMEMLKKRGFLREDYVSPTEPPKVTKTKRPLGTIKPEQIEKIELAVVEKKISRQVYAQLRNGFTGQKRTRIEELSEVQADELFKTILDLTPDKMGKIKLVDPETISVMKDFIPPNILNKRAITTGDIYHNINEAQVGWLVSLFRPIRKVLTSGELLPNERSVAERIYDTISTAEEDRNVQYRDWHQEYTKLYRAARKESRNVDVNVFGYIEKGQEVSPKTRELAEFLKDFYSDSLPVMKPKRVRQKYITHTKPTFWEAVKANGFRETLKQVIEPNIAKEENIDPGIIINLDYIVGKEKFNPFALPRSKYAAYSKKLRKAVDAYASLYFYKNNFDPVMSKVLTMNKALPGSTQFYVKKYLQTVGGRPLDFRLWQGYGGRTIKRAINMGIRLEYGTLLGLNPASALGNISGGTWNNIADISPNLLALGNKRLATKQGRKILEKYGLTSQTLWLEPVGGIQERLSKAERGLFTLMQGGEFYLRGSAALAHIPENEFQSGELSFRTRAIIRRQLGRTQGLFGPAQAPLASQLTLLRPVWMFKHWMINEMELWNSFVKESIARARRNPGWKNRTIGNGGVRKMVKYLTIGILFYLFGNEFLKKEMRQKIAIPSTLIGTFLNWTDSAPLYEDLWMTMQVSTRVANGEFREARDEFIAWVKTKGTLKKFADLLEGIQEQTVSAPDGDLREYVSRGEAIERFFVGTWTAKGQKERELNEELSKLLPFESYTAWSQAFGPRKVKTDYQKIKEDIMDYIKKKGYWHSPEEGGEGGTLELDKQIERMFAVYNSQALKRLEKWLEEAEQLTGQKIEVESKNSLKMKVTIQEDDIARWIQTEYDQEIIPRLLRRVR